MSNVRSNLLWSITIVVLSIALPIIFAVNHIMDFANVIELVIYIIVKLFAFGLLAYMIVYPIVKKSTIYYTIYIFSLVIGFQIFPFIIRLLALVSNIEACRGWWWIITLLVSIITTAFVSIIVLTYKAQDKRLQDVANKVKSSEYEVKTTQSYLDDNGDLKAK